MGSYALRGPPRSRTTCLGDLGSDGSVRLGGRRCTVEHALEHAVDSGVNRHPAVARVDLDALGVGVQASAPVDDRVCCASRSRPPRMLSASGAARCARKSSQHSPSRQLLENTPGSPRSPRRAIQRTVRSTDAETASEVAHGRAEHDQTADSCPGRAPRAHGRAHRHGFARSARPGCRKRLRDPADGISRRETIRSAQLTLARMPLIATRWPRRVSQRRIIASEASPAMKPGISSTGGASARRWGGFRAVRASRLASSPL